MKVLFVSSGNLNNGQPSILIKNQGESLNAQGVQVYYYTIKKKGIIGYLRSVWKIAKQIRNIQPDYIHSHYSLSAFSTSIAILFFNIKIPHTVSLMGSDTKMNGWKRSLTIYLSKHQWSHTIVKATRMAKELGLKKYEIVPNGVDLNKIKPTNSKNNRTIIFPANPSRVSKNYELAEQAITILKKSMADLNFEICYGLSHEEIISKIQNSGVVLVTSLWEGSPNIVKEAMALNKPIVCTKVGDVEILLNKVDGTYMVDFDPNDVAAGIKSAILFGENEGSTIGRKKLEKLNLDSDSIAKKLMTIYKS